MAFESEAQIKPTGLPRMADFALWGAACESIFWRPGTFSTAYMLNRAEIVEALIGSDPVAAAVRLLMARWEFWEGQASDLDGVLRVISGNLEEAKNWPAEPRLLANRLRDLAPSLSKVGIAVTSHRSPDRDRRRLITISANHPGPAGDDLSPETATIPASTASEEPVSGQKQGHNGAGGEDHASVKAQIADAAETEKSELPSATPSDMTSQATDAADAGIKHKRFKPLPIRSLVKREIPILGRRDHGKANNP